MNRKNYAETTSLVKTATLHRAPQPVACVVFPNNTHIYTQPDYSNCGVVNIHMLSSDAGVKDAVVFMLDTIPQYGVPYGTVTDAGRVDASMSVTKWVARLTYPVTDEWGDDVCSATRHLCEYLMEHFPDRCHVSGEMLNINSSNTIVCFSCDLGERLSDSEREHIAKLIAELEEKYGDKE